MESAALSWFIGDYFKGISICCGIPFGRASSSQIAISYSRVVWGLSSTVDQWVHKWEIAGVKPPKTAGNDWNLFSFFLFSRIHPFVLLILPPPLAMGETAAGPVSVLGNCPLLHSSMDCFKVEESIFEANPWFFTVKFVGWNPVDVPNSSFLGISLLVTAYYCIWPYIDQSLIPFCSHKRVWL